MSSAFSHTFIFSNTGLNRCSIDGTNLTDCVGDGGSLVPGGMKDDFGICPAVGAGKNYSEPFVIPSQAKDFVFCSICSVCSCKMSIEMSPDGVNWCDCLDAAQKACKDIDCSLFTTGTCNCKVCGNNKQDS